MAQNPQTKTATTAKPTTVLERIKAFFKLDDAGRVENFFKNEIKTMLLKIRGLEMNIKSNELKLEIELAAIDSALEDAVQGIEDAYTAVKPEDVTNNESMTKFSPKYWRGIEEAEALVLSLHKQREAIYKYYNEALEDNKTEISILKARIAKLS